MDYISIEKNHNELASKLLNLVQKGSYNEIKSLLLKNKELVYYKFSKYNGTKLLHFAAIAGDVSIVELLLDITNNEDINCENDEGNTNTNINTNSLILTLQIVNTNKDGHLFIIHR